MSTSAQGPQHVAADPDYPPFPILHPVENLRSAIRKIDDCARRMMDACGTDLLGGAELSYLNQQMVHLGNAYVSANSIINSIRLLHDVAQEDVQAWPFDEIVELATPTTIVPSDKGGAA